MRRNGQQADIYYFSLNHIYFNFVFQILYISLHNHVEINLTPRLAS